MVPTAQKRVCHHDGLRFFNQFHAHGGTMVTKLQL